MPTATEARTIEPEEIQADFENEIEDIQENDNIVKAFVLGDNNARIGDKKPSGTQQIKEDPFVDFYENGDAIVPPYNPSIWAELLEKSIRLNRCVNTYARNTVGLGWNFTPRIEPGEELSHEQQVQFDTEARLARPVFTDPNDELPFTETMVLVKVDEEATGNGYLEAVRNLKDEVIGLWHLPSHTMRVKKGGTGYIQIRGNKKKYFKNFNDKKIYQAEDGKEVDGSLPLDERATEVIHFQIYSPRSTWYGVPRYAGASTSITGNRLAALRNVNFFENDATPRLIISVSGGKLSAKSIEMIENFISKSKGIRNAHRVVVLQAEGRRMQIGQEDKTKVEVIPLTVGSTDDASFLNYRNANDEEIREAFGIAKVLIGTTADVNRASAYISRQATIEQEFIPDILAKEYRINHTVMKSFNSKIAKFNFVRPSTSDPLDHAKILDLYGKHGGVTPNDLRSLQGKSLFTEAWANKPLQIAVLEMQIQKFIDKINRGGNETAEEFTKSLIEVRDMLTKSLTGEVDPSAFGFDMR